MTDGPVILGVDLGTSAVKVVAVGDDGAVVAAARCGYPTHRPEAQAAEQDPQDWWRAVRTAGERIAAAVDPRRWRGIGLSGMLPTLVELDADGSPTGPAITWEDARAEEQATDLRDEFGDAALYRITGQRVDGRYLAPMHARLRKLGRAGAGLAGAKDALFGELTGQLLTDPSTAAGSAAYDIEQGSWNADIAAAAGICGLPEVAPARTALPLRPAWAQRWAVPGELPVVLGAADSVLGAVGVGAVDHGDVGVIAGTSAIVLGISDQPTRDPAQRYLVTPLAGPGWGLEMDLLAMGSAFDAVAALFGLDGPAALLDAAGAVPAEQAPLFLPYLTPGEQGALWDPSLTGTLQGLHLGMGVGHIGRALLTGIVVELRRCIDVLAATTGHAGPVRLGGGSAVSPLMWRDLADATGREVWVDLSLTDHSAIGAALFAAEALGTSVERSGRPTVVRPRPEYHDWWTECLARHDAARLRERGAL
ncbi:FGGY-family carbohydrate kinase [Mycobacterium sp. shizuoka-1]|uniref:xylulokinase n=1 Tax=Mycobacterium sp. shizuoka-1 TaxID=2039281 RepID=UPI000C0656C1|nr:FGGY family carbohydrate kinase [Mycobacterium sp. shizuoka-1]GAY18312.1 xylulokinase [Mycobacterium sp. shizuoka-1]